MNWEEQALEQFVKCDSILWCVHAGIRACVGVCLEYFCHRIKNIEQKSGKFNLY